MAKTQFVVLSKYKIDSVENGISEFLAEDLMDVVESSKSLIITSPDVLADVRNKHPDYKFEYVISIEKRI